MKLDRITLKYIRDYGQDPSDLDEETLREASEEAHFVANGGVLLDGVLCHFRPKPPR